VAAASCKPRDIVEEVERELIIATLKENNGNILRTSTILGLTRKGLARIIHKLFILVC
jgi:transcriptional regulator with GAF, ATPase, and Fis domain